jgi:hypothetical protein
MTDRLFINGLEIDLSGGTIIATTYQANNIGELQKRQGSYTNTFSVVMNDHNKKVLEHADLMNSATLYPYQQLTATLIQEGIEVFTDGSVQILPIENGIAKINIVAGNVDLSKAIGDLIVGELFKDDIVYAWNLTNVFNSRDKSQYYIYPIIDWRTDIDTMFDSPTIDVRQLLPCALMTSIFSRLEDYTGYTFTGSYIESDDHKNMILTPSDFSRNPDYFEEEETYADLVSSSTQNAMVMNVTEGSGTQELAIPLQLVNNNGTFYNGSFFTPVDQIGTLRIVGTLAIKWEYDEGLGFLEWPETRSYHFVTQIKENGTIIAEETSDFESGEIYDLNSFKEFVIDVTTSEMVFNAGDQYFVQIILKAERHSNSSTILTAGFTDYYAKFSFLPSPSIAYAQDIRFRDLFRMSVKDVFYDILNLRGILIQTNSYAREIKFTYFDDLLKNRSIAKDWSDKVDINSSILSYQFGSYAQKNNLIFKDNSEVTKDLGNYYFNVSDENLEAEKDVVKIKHPATEQTNKYLGSNIPSIEAIDSLNKWQKPEYRILQMSVQNSSYDVTFDDGSSTLVTTSNIPYAKFEGFDVLVPKYYNALTEILDRTKALGLVINLTPIDIQELDFSIPIFLDVPELDVNGYFYINKISKYRQGKTSCELIRL